ncbi:ABC transporter permease [Streptomyces sp. NPDC048324]|uniref:ABC transporter permease n=1 Tax=Streptomyces sp. NPDC048324 TaxID=3157205 RepID=UPI0034423A88
MVTWMSWLGVLRRTGPVVRRTMPAIVITVIVAAAAGLFAGSYSFNLAHPTPHRVPVGTLMHDRVNERFIAAWDDRLNTELVVRVYPDETSALHAVDTQEVFALVRSKAGSDYDVALQLVPAAGASVARVLQQQAPAAARAVGVSLHTTELRPLQAGDPQGLAIFYITLAAVVLGFIGAAQLNAHAGQLRLHETVLAIACYSALGALAICTVVDWMLHVLDLPVVESWAILAFTMFTCGLVFTAFHVLVGRWAILPTWLLLVMVGNPASGGAVSSPLLPEPTRSLGRWLPPGASVSAQHTAIYFNGHQYVTPFLTLAVWCAAAASTAWVWRRRRCPIPSTNETQALRTGLH